MMSPIISLTLPILFVSITIVYCDFTREELQKYIGEKLAAIGLDKDIIEASRDAALEDLEKFRTYNLTEIQTKYETYTTNIQQIEENELNFTHIVCVDLEKQFSSNNDYKESIETDLARYKSFVEDEITDPVKIMRTYSNDLIQINIDLVNCKDPEWLCLDTANTGYLKYLGVEEELDEYVDDYREDISDEKVKIMKWIEETVDKFTQDANTAMNCLSNLKDTKLALDNLKASFEDLLATNTKQLEDKVSNVISYLNTEGGEFNTSLETQANLVKDRITNKEKVATEKDVSIEKCIEDISVIDDEKAEYIKAFASNTDQVVLDIKHLVKSATNDVSNISSVPTNLFSDLSKYEYDDCVKKLLDQISIEATKGQELVANVLNTTVNKISDYKGDIDKTMKQTLEKYSDNTSTYCEEISTCIATRIYFTETQRLILNSSTEISSVLVNINSSRANFINYGLEEKEDAQVQLSSYFDEILSNISSKESDASKHDLNVLECTVNTTLILDNVLSLSSNKSDKAINKLIKALDKFVQNSINEIKKIDSDFQDLSKSLDSCGDTNSTCVAEVKKNVEAKTTSMKTVTQNTLEQLDSKTEYSRDEFNKTLSDIIKEVCDSGRVYEKSISDCVLAETEDSSTDSSPDILLILMCCLLFIVMLSGGLGTFTFYRLKRKNNKK